MKTVQISLIQIAPNRQRKVFDLKSLSDLGESIKRFGLFHPPVLREENGQLILVAGERRIRAIADLQDLGDTFSFNGQQVPPGEVPYVTLGELDELDREEAELEENIRRSDLTWQERAAATARLSALRSKRAISRGETPPTVAEISLEIRGSSAGVNQEATRREIIVAKHLADPEVAAAKSTDEAFKLLRRKEEASKRVQRAAEVGRTYSAETAHTAVNEDSLLWMMHAPSETFDVIITDPPYGIGADTFGDSGGAAAGAHFYEDSYENWKALISTLSTSGYRVARPQAHLYCFCDITRFEELKEILTAAGWKCFRTPLIWHKPNGNRVPWVESGPQRRYEIILYAKKGDKPVTRIYGDVLEYRADENLGHPAQKPVALYVDLLRRSCTAGDQVLDPFAGSGPIFPAAQELKLRATGVEKDPAAYGIALARLDKLKIQPELEGLV